MNGKSIDFEKNDTTNNSWSLILREVLAEFIGTMMLIVSQY
jgi:hypothetical protein